MEQSPGYVSGAMWHRQKYGQRAADDGVTGLVDGDAAFVV